MNKSVWVYGSHDATRQIVPLWRDADGQGLAIPPSWRVAVVYPPPAWTPQQFEEHLDRWVANSDDVRREDIMEWSSILLTNGVRVNLCHVGGTCIVVTTGWAPRAFADFNLWSDNQTNPSTTATVVQTDQVGLDTAHGTEQ